jgi:hypothetical protein
VFPVKYKLEFYIPEDGIHYMEGTFKIVRIQLLTSVIFTRNEMFLTFIRAVLAGYSKWPLTRGRHNFPKRRLCLS